MTGSWAEQAAPLGSAGVLWRYLLLHRCRSNTEDTAKGHIYCRATATLFHASFRSPAQTSIPLCSFQRGRTSFSAAFPFTLSHLLQPASSPSTLFPLTAWLVAHGWHWWTLVRSHTYVLYLLTPFTFSVYRRSTCVKYSSPGSSPFPSPACSFSSHQACLYLIFSSSTRTGQPLANKLHPLLYPPSLSRATPWPPYEECL